MSNTEQPRRIRIGQFIFVGSVLVAAAAFLVAWVRYDRTATLIGQLRSGGIVTTHPVGPDWLRQAFGNDRMKGFESIDYLSLNSRETGVELPVDDDWLAQLGRHFGIRTLELRRAPLVSDRGLQHLGGLIKLETLNISLSQVSNDGLRHLSRLTNLESLTLNGTQITDSGLKHLAGLIQLKDLSLSGTQINGDGLRHLGRLPNLEILVLDQTQISNDGLRHLSGLTQLGWLSLIGTEIGDDALEHLSGLVNLDHLRLYGTQVTDGGVVELKKALPNCSIASDTKSTDMPRMFPID